MKLIKSKAEYLPQANGIEGVYKQIEIAGRTCYKSEDKITEDSAKGFVDRMIKSKHFSMLEHGTVYLMVHTIDPKEWDKRIGHHHLMTVEDCRDDLRTNPTYDKNGKEFWWAKESNHIAHRMAVKYADNPYSKVKIVLTKHEVNTEGGIIITPTGDMPHIEEFSGKIISIFNTILISTNLRVLIENNWLDDLKYLCEPTEFHEKRYTMRFTTSIGITRELIRHRVFSFANESTRYCNYMKNKFNNELIFIIPSWADIPVEHVVLLSKGIRNPKLAETVWCIRPININETVVIPDNPGYLSLLEILGRSELEYQSMIKDGLQPQQAREVLPLCTKSELIMTGFASDWKHFLDLRYFEKTGKVHPDMKVLMEKLKEEATKYEIWDSMVN